MINLSGYLKRTLLLSSILVLVSILFPSKISANEELTKSSNSTYSISQEGDLEADYTFTLSRKSEIPSVVTKFSLSIPFEDYSSITITVGGNNYKYTTKKQSGSTEITFELPNIIVTRSSPLFISTKVNLEDYVNTEGENYHILVPPVPSFVTDAVFVRYPAKWGDIAWSSTSWTSDQESRDIKTLKLKLNQENVNPSIALVIGKDLGYKLEMNKPIQNLSENELVYKISLPREGDGQHLLYTKIQPKPFGIDYDEYGNLNVSYILAPSESKQIIIEGYIFFDDIEHEIPSSFTPYLLKDGYWEFSDDTERKRLTVYLRSNGINNEYPSMTSEEQAKTVKLLNDYVIDRLSPVTNIDSNIKSEIRNGASNISTMLTSGAYPDDYTDLLMAVMRDLEIPSRMVLGYITGLNSYQKAGFFHTWVEYWDANNNQWKMLDPGLQDYFPTRFINTQYDHVRLAVRVNNSITPNISKFSTEEFKLLPAQNSISPYNEFDIRFNTIGVGKNLTKGALIISNIGNKIVKLVDVKLQSKNELVKPLDFWNLKSIIPSESSEIKVSFPVEPGDGDKIVATFQDFEGNTIRKTVPVTYSITTASPSNLINLAISFIIFAIIYIVVTRIGKRKNG